MSSQADPDRSRQIGLDTGRLARQLGNDFPGEGVYWVAFSGGMDSTVLLAALAEQRDALPRTLRAIHIDHQLQPASAGWASHCADVCRSLDIPLVLRTVDGRPVPGESPEAAARDARYAAIASEIADGDVVLTAHHRDDQAETVMLQLMRAAGVAGIAAMPPSKRFGQGWLARPLLGLPRSALQRWAVDHAMNWIEDPSNQQLEADRNYVRHEVLPRLVARWPAAINGLSSTAAHAAAALGALREQAGEDLERVRVDRYRLDLSTLTQLSSYRRRALLLAWFREFDLPAPGSDTLAEMLRQLSDAGGDTEPCFGLGDRQLRRYRHTAWLVKPTPSLPPPDSLPWSHGAERLDLPLGSLRFERRRAGIAPERWLSGQVEVRFRQPGIRCRPAGRDGGRDFKGLAQECSVPPWLRPWLPLIFIDGQLAAAASCCICKPFGSDGDGWWPVWSELPEAGS